MGRVEEEREKGLLSALRVALASLPSLAAAEMRRRLRDGQSEFPARNGAINLSYRIGNAMGFVRVPLGLGRGGLRGFRHADDESRR